MQFGSIQNVNLTHIKVTYVKTELVSNVNITTKAGCFPAVGEKFWNSSERDNKLTMVSSDVAYFGTATWYDTDKKTVLNSSSTVEELHTYYLKVNIYTLTSSGYDYDKGAKATVDGKEYPIDIYNAIYVEYTTPVISGYGDDEYIVSYTNTFFDSGYVPTEKTMIVTKMRPMSDAGAQKVGSKTEDGFFGVVNSGSEVSWKRNNGNHDFLEIFQDVKYSGTEGSAANGATYTFVLKQGEFKTYIEKDGEMELYQTKTWTPAAFQKGDATIYIGAVNDANNSKTWRSNALIYFFDIYEDGVLVKHFEPDFSNGEYCLYEYESGSYAMNIGSGEVVACTGEHHYADVTVYGVTQRMCLICGEKVPIAQITIGETTTEYYGSDLLDAVGAVSSTATVKLLDDINTPYSSLSAGFYSPSDITLDLNGHTFTGDISINRASFKLMDSSADKKGTVKGSLSAMNENAEYVIESGNIISESSCVSMSNGKLTINGGTFKGESAIWQTSAEVTINGGTFVGSSSCIEGVDGTLVINGGSFHANDITIDDTGCLITLNGGTFTSDGDAVIGHPNTLSGHVILGKGKVLKLADNTIVEELADNITMNCSVVDESSLTTGIDAIEADKAQKSLKTIENGKVVIIRGDKKWDVSGRKM